MNAYRVHCLCRRVLHDEDFRREILADPAAALASMPLGAAEREALLAGDVARLYRGGAHPFLLLILSRFGVFGLDLPTFNARIRTGSTERRGGAEHHDATEIEG